MKGLSYSNFSLFRTCGEKYRLKVIEEVQEKPSHALLYGTAIHAGLKVLLEKKDVDLAMDVFETYWLSVCNTVDDYQRLSPGDLGDMGVRFISNFHKRYGKNMELIVSEERMYATFNDIPLEGTPDALVKLDGRLTLLDYKTSQYAYDKGRIKNSLQLNMYAWLLEENGYLVDDICYITFVKGTGAVQTPLTTPYSRPVALGMLQDMTDYFSMNKNKLVKNPNACIIGSQKCSFMGRCWGE